MKGKIMIKWSQTYKIKLIKNKIKYVNFLQEIYSQLQLIF